LPGFPKSASPTADDGVVHAERVHARDRDVGRRERVDDAILAIDLVRRGEQLAGRFLPHDIALVTGGEQEGRVRLPTRELSHRERAAKTCDVLLHVGFERGDVEAVRAPDLAGLVLEGVASIHAGIATSRRPSLTSRAHSVRTGNLGAD